MRREVLRCLRSGHVALDWTRSVRADYCLLGTNEAEHFNHRVAFVRGLPCSRPRARQESSGFLETRSREYVRAGRVKGGHARAFFASTCSGFSSELPLDTACLTASLRPVRTISSKTLGRCLAVTSNASASIVSNSDRCWVVGGSGSDLPHRNPLNQHGYRYFSCRSFFTTVPGKYA
jgi:hypothetical protein